MSSRYRRPLAAAAIAANLLLAPSLALAGTGIKLAIINLSQDAVKVGPLRSVWHWYPQDLEGDTTVRPGMTRTLTTEMCSSLKCIGESHVEFDIIMEGSATERRDLSVHLMGITGSGPQWRGQIHAWVSGLGQMFVANAARHDGTGVLSKAHCEHAGVYNTMACTIIIDKGLFDTTNPKYHTTEPVQNSRNYFDKNKTLHTDGLVFTGTSQEASRVEFDRDGHLRYKGSTIPLQNPACGAEAGTVLYAVTEDWRMYAMPVCNERAILTLPFVYKDDYVAKGAKGLLPVDIGETAAVTAARQGLNITHGGLAAAKKVRSAGEMTVTPDGSVASIDNNSGHYTPSAPALDAVVQSFAYAGARGAFVGDYTDKDGIRTYRSSSQEAAQDTTQ